MQYVDYVSLFNAGDDIAFAETTFVDDCIVFVDGRELRGREALLSELSLLHDGMRAVMRPQRVLEMGEDVFAEIDMDFHATAARPDFIFGPVRPGDLITVKMLSAYRKRDGRFAEMKVAHWPSELGVTKLPRLGPHASQLAAFEAYAAAFSAGDTAGFTQFYTDDIVLDLGPQMPPLRGKAEIAAFYGKMYETIRESLTIHNLLVNENSIMIEHTARFTAMADAPEFDVMPMRKGDIVDLPGLVYYTLRGGLMSHVGVYPRGAPVKRE